MKKVIVFYILLWIIPSKLLAFGPIFVISPDTIDYGFIPVGEYSSKNFMVSNIGDGNGEISFGTITGPGSNFIGWEPYMHLIVPAGSTSFVSIFCYPSAPGIIDATGTIYTNDPQLPVFYLHFIGTILPPGYELSGVITYSNNTNTPLTNLTLKLKDTNGTVVNTCTTNNSGYYHFSDVQNGYYTFEIITTKPWGGVTALDVMMYKKHIAGIAQLNGIYLASGDVNGSGMLTAVDVLLIKKRIAGIQNSFPVGDWLFNNLPVTIDSSSVTYDFSGICYGDANGSYVPPVVVGQH
ncbi:MAG: dockerin type I domain-containing protein [Bacteroidales bacterium]|jgi:hypothetical protein|nr:dockerin type I domain-containing protein [Bacteroidales bacterium]